MILYATGALIVLSIALIVYAFWPKSTDEEDTIKRRILGRKTKNTSASARQQAKESVARRVMEDPTLLSTRASREEGTILFSDIQGFTAITEKLTPDALIAQLNEYFTAMGSHVVEEHGYVDKFIGDALMAYWGPPSSHRISCAPRTMARRRCKRCPRCMGPISWARWRPIPLCRGPSGSATLPARRR